MNSFVCKQRAFKKKAKFAAVTFLYPTGKKEKTSEKKIGKL